MSHWELTRFPDDATLARAAAEQWLQRLGETPPGATPCVALSGGRIAGRFFSEIASLAQQNRARLKQIHFFFADERCVPPTDPESNYRLAHEHLFAPLSLDPTHIHRLPGELDAQQAAAQASAELCRIATLDRNNLPVLDWVFLGMGEDGHIASLFPNQVEEAAASQAVYRAVVGPKPPPRRLTLGYAPLRVAREVWVLASGAGKAEALRESLREGGLTPLARLLRERPNTQILTDIA